MSSKNALRVLLLVLAADALLGSVVVFVGGRAALIRTLTPNAQSQATDLFFLQKLETAALGLGLAVMFALASVQPSGNRAVIVGTAVGVVAMAVTEILANYARPFAQLYPSSLVWTHALVRLSVGAALLVCFRRLQATSNAGEKAD